MEKFAHVIAPWVQFLAHCYKQKSHILTLKKKQLISVLANKHLLISINNKRPVLSKLQLEARVERTHWLAHLSDQFESNQQLNIK